MKLQILTFMCLLLAHSLAMAGMYRWVDDDGKVHYSDSVPPERSQGGHTELDESGNHVNKVAAAKTAEQVKEEAWLAELEEKLRLKKAQQRRKDELLLNSYASIEQFDSFYAARFKVFNDEYKQLRLLRDKLLEELARLQKQYKAGKSRGAKKRVQGFIDINSQNTAAYEKAIEQNRLEDKMTRSEAEELRKRYLALLKKAGQQAKK